MVVVARQNADSLKKKLDQLKKKLKEEEKEKTEAQAKRKGREDLLHKSTFALLGSFLLFYP
jgi:transposase